MGLVRVAGHSSLNQSTAHDGGDAVDQGMMNTAFGDVNHAVGTEFEQTHFGRAQPAADGQSRAKSKSRSLPRNHRNVGQSVGARQRVERVPGRGGDALRTEPRTARARGTVRADLAGAPTGWSTSATRQERLAG